MKAGGNENGCDGSRLMCDMRQDLKCSVTLWPGRFCRSCSGGKEGEAGEAGGLSATDPSDNDGAPERTD